MTKSFIEHNSIYWENPNVRIEIFWSFILEPKDCVRILN